MARQLVFTSAQQGLTQGRTGFCTVARHRDLRERLVPMLEGFSVYPHGAQPAPVICTFRLVDVAGTRFPVLSRLVDAGTDYTHRTNFLAHHLILEPAEVAGLPAPAEIFLRWPGWLNRWDGAPRWLEAAERVDLNTLPPAPTAALPAETWLRLTGQAGRAALLIEDSSAAEAVLRCNPEQEASLLGLLREASALLRPAEAWRTTFTTWRQGTDQAGDFIWAAQRAGITTPAPAWGDERVLDLTRPNTLAAAPAHALAQQARDPAHAPTAPTGASATAHAAVVKLPAEIKALAPSALLVSSQPSQAGGQNPPGASAKKSFWVSGAGVLAGLGAMAVVLAGALILFWSQPAASPAATVSVPTRPDKVAAESVPVEAAPTTPAPEPGQPPPVEPASPAPALASTPPPPEKHESAFSNLGVVEASVQIAQAALSKASPGNRAGLLPKIIAEVNAAAANTDAAIAFIKAHPEADTLQTGPGPEDSLKDVPTALPPEHQMGKSPQWERAFAALYTAFHELTNNPDPDYQGPIWGDLGGNREKIRQDLGTALIDIYGSFLPAPGSATAAAPLNTAPPPNPVRTASTALASPRVPTDIRELTLFRLRNTQTYLQAALKSLLSAAPGTKATMAKAIADVNTTLTDTTAALTFVNSHGDSSLLSSRPAQTKALNVYMLRLPPSYRMGANPGKEAAYTAMRAAESELVVANTPGDNAPKLGEIGGFRLRLLRDLNQASADLLANLGVAGVAVTEGSDGRLSGAMQTRPAKP